MRGPTLGQTRAQPFGKIGAGAWLVCVSTSPRVSAPLARCAREAAPFSLTANIIGLPRPPPRPRFMRSSYAGSSGGVGGALVGSARLVWRGCSPAPPLRRAATPAGGARWLHDPPRVRWPVRPAPVGQRPAHPPWLTFGVGWRAIFSVVLSRTCLAGGFSRAAPSAFASRR